MQGFNMGRYIPPDQEGLTTANKAAGKKHALGSRARHLQTKGALIVRFEMPFAVWCTTCKPHETIIGQGVRFNAEKKKVGAYYSTPIYSFRMKHTVCGGWIEIRTDPKNTAYVVTEGGRKRDTGEGRDDGGDGEILIRFPGERGLEEEKERNDAFARLEGKVEDKKQFDTATARIDELLKRQERDWDDPYEQSRRLRKTFRTERKRLEKINQANESLKDKMSLGIELLEETEEDRMRAGLVDFGPTASDDLGLVSNSRNRPMFHDAPSKTSSTVQKKQSTREQRGKLKSEILAAQRKALLSNELRGNTRAVVDPFLNEDARAWQPSTLKSKITREKNNTDLPVGGGAGEIKQELDQNARDSTSSSEKDSVALVTYGSESE